MKKCLVFFTVIALILSNLSSYASSCAPERAEINEYINSLVKKYNFDKEYLVDLFCTITKDEEVIHKLSKPAEAKPWYEYKELVITPEKIEKGLSYWQQHEKTLRLAEEKYGVPISIIVAVIGVETKYGEKKGTFPVFNTLATLAFNNGRRANFFRSELTQYLLLTRENGFKPLLLKGSYAGALGLPQFMPSSYRHYAVDFYNKGYSDLFNNDADAIGSVAHYLQKHGWQKGEPVVIPALLTNDDIDLPTRKGFKPTLTTDDLAKYQIIPQKSLHGRKVSLIKLELENDFQYWLGLHNFYVISTYNNSELYVMAVNVLAEKLSQQRKQPHHKKLAATVSPAPIVNKEEIVM